ncbi:MAG: hypothetical protein ACQETE_10975 [Bacteroidota bacterium]
MAFPSSLFCVSGRKWVHSGLIGLFLLISIFPINGTAQTAENLKEEFLRTYDPQGYSYYKFGTGIAEQGKRIADNLSRSLSRSQDLIQTSDADALLADFNQKMRQIETLEARFIEQSNQFGYQQGKKIGDMINSGDAEGALYGVLGTLNGLSETRKAEKELEARKEQLKEQRRQKMSQIYWKAVEFNDNTIKNYLNRAAFAENPDVEQYNLNFVEHLQCHAQNMERTWSPNHTRWLNNTCAKPVKPEVSKIENMFVAKDVQYQRIAQRKYDYYQQSGHSEFLKAAISYAAAAANEKASAENFYHLGAYYEEESTILALSTMQTAKQIDPSYFTGDKSETLKRIILGAEVEVSMALRNNDQEYIQSFMDAGLDRTIRINGNSVLMQAIELDQPDAVQLILNNYIEGLPQSEVNQKLRKTIMLASANNSTACLNRFIDLGVDVNFTMGGKAPIDVANNVQAEDAYQLLLDRSGKRAFYEKKYGVSETQFFVKAKEDPTSAGSLLNEFSAAQQISIVEQLLDRITEDPVFADIIRQSEFARSHIRSTPKLYAGVKKAFVEDLQTASPASKSHLYIRAGLIAQESIPYFGDIKVWKEEGEAESEAEAATPSATFTYEGSLQMDRKLGLLLGWYQGMYDRLDGMETNQYFTEATKKKGLTGIMNSLQYVTGIKNNLGSLSTDEEHAIDAQFYSLLAADSPGKFKTHEQEFKDYVAARYQIQENVSVNDKLDLIITYYKWIQKVTGNDMTKHIQGYQDYKNSTTFNEYDDIAINTGYGAAAIRFNKPLDHASYAYIDGKLNEMVFGKNEAEEKKMNRNLDEESLAYVAFHHNNYEVFRALDELHDLSAVTNRRGESLLLSMIAEQDRMLNDLSYFSNDFDFTGEIEGKMALIYFLEQALAKDKIYTRGRNLTSSSVMETTVQLISHYEWPADLRVTANGGTLYHYVIEQMSSDEMTIMQAQHLLRLLHRKSGIDKNIKDNDGYTAYDLWKKNKRDIEKLWISRFRDTNKKIGMKLFSKSIAKDDWAEYQPSLEALGAK